MNSKDMTDVLEALLKENRLGYGDRIEKKDFLEWFGVKPVSDDELEGLPPDQMRKIFDAESLEALTISGFVRDKLLNHGRYFYENKGAYCVALPTENSKFSKRYLTQANKKMNRSHKLLSNTPAEFLEHDNTSSRTALSILMNKKLLEKSMRKH